MDRPDGASETEHPSSTPKVTVKIGSTTVKGVSTKKPKISVAPTSSSEQVEEAKESFGQVRKSILFLFAVVILYALYIVFSGQFDEFVVALADVDTGWLIAGALCYFVYYLLGILAYVISVITDPESPVGVRDLMSVGNLLHEPHAKRRWCCSCSDLSPHSCRNFRWSGRSFTVHPLCYV